MSTTPAKLSVAAGAEVVDLARVVIVAETESSDVGLAVFDTSAGVVVVRVGSDATSTRNHHQGHNPGGDDDTLRHLARQDAHLPLPRVATDA